MNYKIYNCLEKSLFNSEFIQYSIDQPYVSQNVSKMDIGNTILNEFNILRLNILYTILFDKKFLILNQINVII